MQILITGGSGFIGRNLAEHLASRHRVEAPSSAELNLLDAEAVRSYLKARQFDVVVHAAAKGVSRRVPATPDLLRDNCRMFFHLAANRERFGRLIFLGSGAIYDRTHWRLGLREDDSYLHVPADDYGLSKYICARSLDSIEDAVELRLFGVFGRYEDWSSRFVSNACCRALWGLPILVERNVIFDHLDVDDVCRAVECCLERPLRHRHYNVCRGESFELTALAKKVAIAAGCESLPIIVRHPEPGSEYGGDNSRVLAEISEWRIGRIDESIGRLYRWYAERKSSIDPGQLE